MRSRLLVVIFGTILLSSLAPVGAQQTGPLSTAEIAKIKADVAAATQNYVKVFSARDANGVAERIFSNPAISIGADGVTMLTPEKQSAFYEGIFRDLAKTEYEKSEYPNPTVCVLNANVAIASGRYYRYKKDGSLLSEGSSSYLYARTKDGWKIVASLGLDKNKAVTCND